ncbi:unnamed protein product, partial [Ilex paraguariensis]
MADKVLEKGLKAKAKSEMIKKVEVINPQGEVEARPWPGFKPKPGSVIPAKKKLVKTMVVDYIGQSVASLFNKYKNKQKINP